MHPANTHVCVTSQFTRGPSDASCRGTAGRGVNGPQTLRPRSKVMSLRKPFPVPSERSPGPREGLRTLADTRVTFLRGRVPFLPLRLLCGSRAGDVLFLKRATHKPSSGLSALFPPPGMFSALLPTQLALSPNSGPCRLQQATTILIIAVPFPRKLGPHSRLILLFSTYHQETYMILTGFSYLLPVNLHVVNSTRT